MTMREKIADALLDEFHEQRALMYDPEDGDPLALIDGHIDIPKLIDVLLDALREPTEEMEEARRQYYLSVCRGTLMQDFPGAGEYETMLSAARSGAEQSLAA